MEDFIYDPSLVLYLPLWKLDGSKFRSQDAYGHLCTVTGALWRSKGRYFDGVDDKIVIGANSIFEITGGTVMAWVNQTFSATKTRYISDIRPLAAGSGWVFLTANTNTLDVSQGTCYVNGIKTTTVPAGVWSFAAVAGINMGNGGAATIGARYAHIADYYMLGSIGEVAVYNRTLTPQEIQQVYLATRWRYR